MPIAARPTTDDEDHVVGLVALALERAGRGSSPATLAARPACRPGARRPRARRPAAARRDRRREVHRSPPAARAAARSATACLEGPSAGRVVLEHVEAGGGRAEQHGRRPGPAPARERLAGDRVGAPDGLLEGPGPLDVAPARRPGTGASSVGPALADQDGRHGPLGDDRRERVRSTPLSRPPAISTTGASNARSAAMTASGWVPCESLTKRTPSTIGDRLEAMLDAGEAPQRPRGSRRARPRTAARRRPRPGRWRRCGAPGIASSSSGRIRPSGPVAAGPPPASASRCTPAATIQPSTTPSPPGSGRSQPVADGRRGPEVRVRGDDRILGIEHERPVRIDELGEPALDARGTPRASRAGRGGPRSRSCRRRRSCRATASGAAAPTARRRRDGPGVSSGSRSTIGTPMLPPSTTGCAGSAARSAAVSDDVVVLPFVPVTPIVGAGHRRRNRSGSRDERRAPRDRPRRGVARARRSAARRRGSVVG